MLISFLNADHSTGKSLQFSSGEILHLPSLHFQEIQALANLILPLQLIFLVQQYLHGTLHRLRDLIHVLRLNDSFQVILQDLGEIVLQLAAPEVSEDLRPVGRVGKVAKVRLLFTREDLERGGLADTVGADQTQDLSGPRDRQTMKLEGVLGVPVSCGFLQVTEN